MNIVQLTNVAFADEYFTELSFDSDDWNQLSVQEKERGINVASEFLLTLPLLDFDRVKVPEAIQKACSELALNYAKGETAQGASENANVLSDTFASIKTVYHAGEGLRWQQLGFTSYRAYQYMLPWLSLDGSIRLVRTT